MTEHAGIPSLYLDTSDLSYLVKGKGPGGTKLLEVQAQRLRGLVEDERVRLFVSFVHLAEMAIEEQTHAAARRWLRDVEPVWCFLSAPEDIFRAELLGQHLAVQARPLTLGDLDRMSVATRLGVSVSGSSTARLIKTGSRVAAWAERMSRSADRRARDDGTAKDSDEAVKKLLRGDISWMPFWVRPLASAYLAVAPKVLSRIGEGRSLEDIVKQGKLSRHGLAWVGTLVEPEDWPTATFVAPGNAPRAPACALRAAIEQREARDLARDPSSGTHYDVRHVAFAACCDVATLDATNYDATKKIRAALSRPTMFRTGRLDDVLAHLDPKP